MCFPRNRLQCFALGLSAQAHKLALPLWGFTHLGRQTECEGIPKPRYKILYENQSHLSFGFHPLLAIRVFRAASSIAIQYPWTIQFRAR